MSNTTIRYKRLLELLPRVYANQPKEGHIARLLEALAESLGTYDNDLRRVLYDRWLALATGAKTDAESLSALGHLGSLLHIYRLPPRIEHNGYEFQADPACLIIRFKSVAQRRKALYDLIGDTDDSTEKQYLEARFPNLEFEFKSDDDDSPIDPTLIVSKKEKTPEKHTDENDFELDEDDDVEERDELSIFRSMLEPEPSELYRQRLRITAGVLVRGLVTRRAILSLAIADVGAWPCPKIEQKAVSKEAKALGIPSDMSQAYGISPAQARGCSACHDPKKKTCPFAEAEAAKHRIIEAQLLENPVQREELKLENQKIAKTFRIYSDSLWADRPSILMTLRSSLDKDFTLRICSKTTSEVLAYEIKSGLKSNTVIEIFPQLNDEALVPFESAEYVSHHVWNTDKGQASINNIAINKKQFCYSSSIDNQTPDKTINRIRTPRLVSGENLWCIEAVDNNNSALDFSFDIRLRWFVRRPFYFRLTLPKTESLKQAELRGALQLLKEDLRRVRAAGVRTDLIFPDKPYREAHSLAANLCEMSLSLPQEDLALTLPAFSLEGTQHYTEQHLLDDSGIWISAILCDDDGLGGTRFDQSLFAHEHEEFSESHALDVSNWEISHTLSLSEQQTLQEQKQPLSLDVIQHLSESHTLAEKITSVEGNVNWHEQHLLGDSLYISAIFSDENGIGGTRFDQSLLG